MSASDFVEEPLNKYLFGFDGPLGYLTELFASITLLFRRIYDNLLSFSFQEQVLITLVFWLLLNVVLIHLAWMFYRQSIYNPHIPGN